MNNLVKYFIIIIVFLSVGFNIAVFSQSSTTTDSFFIPDDKNLPEWVKVENLRFVRLDGGYIEIQKAKRTKWGQNWEEYEYETLENIYTKYSDNIIEKLKQAEINVVWVTWSNGWSLEHEAEQRDNLKIFISKCHKNNIKVLAYMCSVTMFWQNMFLDQPESFDFVWTKPSGVPYIYLNENPLRFLAKMTHPGWIDLQKKRVEFALDAGVSGFFFDNPTANNSTEVAYFLSEIQNYIKIEKGRSDVLITSNFGLDPNLQANNQQVDFVFNEVTRPPGVYDSIWMCENIKKIKYIASWLPKWKTAMHEPNYFPGGMRERVILPPKTQKLARAECAAFGATYFDLLEGRFLADLVHDEKEALESWSAIGKYNGFMAKHSKYYKNASQVDNTLILIPDDAKLKWDTWNDNTSSLLDNFTRNNIAYKLKQVRNFRSEDLEHVKLVVTPNIQEIDSAILSDLSAFKNGGGKIVNIGSNKVVENIANINYTIDKLEAFSLPSETTNNFINKIISLSNSYSIDIENAPYVLGNITFQKEKNRAIIHIVNYSNQIAENVKVKVNFNDLKNNIDKSKVQVFSPDFNKTDISNSQIINNTMEFTIPQLDTYSIIVIN